MKIPELKLQIQNYSSEELQLLVIGLYKAIPKSIKEDNGIDEFLKNPAAHGGKKPKKSDAVRPIDEIEEEVNAFVDAAGDGFYFIPNRIIPKNERPKWRFIVKRLYKELSLAATEPASARQAAASLEQLYRLLCKGCDIILFSAYDVFESVGIEQYDFFVRVLELHRSTLPQHDFLEKAVTLLVDNSLNRYTLSSDLMRGIIPFLSTPDLKYLAIEAAGRMHRDVPEPKSKITQRREDYAWARRENILCEFVCRCYFELAEYDNALEYFARKYRRQQDEVKVFVLVRLLVEYNQGERIVRVIADAEKKGVNPRESLLTLKGYIEEHASIPADLYL